MTDNLLKLAAAIVLGITATHPLTFAVELRKIEWRMLKGTSDTRSWGDPSPWHYVPARDIADPFQLERQSRAAGRAHHAQ